jgi:drug/metabolite transporter (DMT)-like permease
MTWFLLALTAPFLYAVTNYIDKVLLERYFKQGGVGTLMIVSAGLSVIALPILYALDPQVLSVGLVNIGVLAGVGVLNILILFFYLKALEGEEVSVTIIFYQLVPVFAALLGYAVLGETLTTLELIAMAIVILGTSIISFEVDAENNFRLRRRTIYYMVAASFCWALGSVVFKAVALEENVIHSLFWEHVMLTLIGVGLFALVRSYRTHFIEALRTNSVPILGLNFLNEGLYMSANAIFAFAYMLAPIALVLLAQSYQSLFALLLGAGLTLFFPRLIREQIRLRHIWQKGFAIAITGIGTYLLLAA